MASALKSALTTSRSRTPSPSTSVPDPSRRDKYLLRVTAGPTYATSSHTLVSVNSSAPTHVSTPLMDAYLNVRIRGYNGLPTSAPPTDERYFSHPLHTSDLHSVGYTFVPKRDIPGQDLVTGFDFDHSIRDRLPPGFKTAMRIATTLLDPGLYADPYSDAPFLYGPALSSFFAFRVGEKRDGGVHVEQGGVIEEGGDGSGAEVREKLGVPAAANKRRKHFLKRERLEGFVFEEGRRYGGDFFNPYLDFANFALKLPGFSISVVRYIDDKTHELRYVLKDRETGEVGLVVVFTLLFGKKLEEALAAEKSAGGKESMEETSASREKEEFPVTNGVAPEPREVLDVEDAQNRDVNVANGTPSNLPIPTTTTEEQPEDHRLDRTHSSDVSATPSSETSEDSASENVSYLTSTLYSALSSLGFGAVTSSSTSSAESSKESSPSRQSGLNRHVESIDDGGMGDYLRSRNARK
ncbi:DUF1769-domain-containing protein [Mytilinidion resinicola]|uniref:DUF1769-domain-containing protein n=1 Tax=Mytilinidion resinicola TaxID=574789 RepID=A0A6A6Y926_9PEZI|nr:DUF1769-domain-containing protein [Mytilinidion resinicola]KAF2804635.1 DUF1769-domain-containing protein [Mytilinidion resinicola]